MGFLSGAGEAAALSLGALVACLALGDSRLWGFEVEAEVLILATFFKVGSTNAFHYVKTILLGNVAKEYKGASSRMAARYSQTGLSIAACGHILLPATEVERGGPTAEGTEGLSRFTRLRMTSCPEGSQEGCACPASAGSWPTLGVVL